MSNNSISTIVDQQTITSMEIAEITGKNHSDVLRAIRKMEPAWEEVHKSKFTWKQNMVDTFNGAKRPIPCCVLTKTECLFVATKFNDVARAKLVLRWEQLEKERMGQQSQPQPSMVNVQSSMTNDSNLPVDPRNMSRLQILQLALQAEEENERLRAEKEELEADKYGLMVDIGQKEQEIAHLQERTAYLSAIMADSSTVTVSQIAQDYGFSAVSFNNLLKGLRIQRKIGEQWVLYSDFVNMGYVGTRMIPIRHAGGQETYKPMTVWTQLGRKFLYDRLKKHGVVPVIERNQLAVK